MTDVWEDVNEYVVCAVPRDDPNHTLWQIVVQRRPGYGSVRVGSDVPLSEDRWAVVLRSQVLNHDREWEFDPIPSSRTDEHLARTRFDNRETALVLARELAPAVEINGLTAAARAEQWNRRRG